MTRYETREVHLARRPDGMPVKDDFRMVTTSLEAPGPGQILVRNILMSVDPYMRVRMAKLPSYPHWELDQVMDGSAIGVVERSEHPELPVGAVVSHRLGWREHAVLDARRAGPVRHVTGIPLAAHLGVLGMAGFTAYIGLTRIGAFAPGESLYVSGAAGAVGNVVGQIARILGAGRVVGSAGTPAKVAYLVDELGFDGAFDYHVESLSDCVAANVPDGIDVYFDNVGGVHLQAALDSMNPHGRVVVCGAIGEYNALREQPGPSNLIYVLTKRLRMEGFTIREHMSAYPAFVAQATTWLLDGQLRSTDTVVWGLGSAVDAFRDLLVGRNIGKMLVRLSEDPAPPPV
ncbi:NADP-dependent oxidoreductase [Acrocarpospora pleiomorpha]|uniref:NADP-dependent oxidoreductase n=1 Tax=Acrocarpospora pleiomorpha TaxID=90975 RepID=A0A5M3XD10_9ACTN|nr:NADP-dependent oxidoreductase [Acrocarpospora pleiomorpha]GES19535.1 NADP-dependent oxidoreductase [Acrocarpospora pleiomorpha]